MTATKVIAPAAMLALAGTVQITEKNATCGATAPDSWTNNVHLTKAA